jgi:pimeloyl-ACP methyl ester carboxylesterase
MNKEKITKNPGDNNMITLSDGRQLSYVDYGDPKGKPVILVHGVPGTGLYWKSLPGFPFRSDLHIIAPSRPGYGLSDRKPGSTLADWPNDVAELADALGLDRFAMVSVSGGGVRVLSCAWKIPERLTSIGLVHSPGHPDTPGYFEEMARTNRFFLRLAARSPWLMRKNMLFVASMIRRNPGKHIDRWRYKFSDPDKAALARPEIRTAMIQNFVHALGKVEGGRAYGDDVVLHHALPWGFALEQIEVKVYLWQSEDDHAIPNTQARYMAEKLPDCQAIFIPNAGHLWHVDHMKDVLDTLVPRRL